MSVATFLVNFVLYFALPLTALAYCWLQKRLTYWKGRNVPGPEPTWRYLAGCHMTTSTDEIWAERDDPISATLFNLEGTKWKFFRNKLSLTFTSGKLKMMYSSIEQIGDKFVAVLKEHAKSKLLRS